MNEVSRVLLERGFTKKSHDYTSLLKTCSRCSLKFPRTADHFRKEKKNKDGLSYLCKSCAAEIGKASLLKHMGKRLEYLQSPEFAFTHLKNRAKRTNQSFSITIDHYLEHLAGKPCLFCGDTNTKHFIQINKQLGYTEENTAACCETCNKMNNIAIASHTTLLDHCSKVHKHSKHL